MLLVCYIMYVVHSDIFALGWNGQFCNLMKLKSFRVLHILHLTLFWHGVTSLLSPGHSGLSRRTREFPRRPTHSLRRMLTPSPHVAPQADHEDHAVQRCRVTPLGFLAETTASAVTCWKKNMLDFRSLLHQVWLNGAADFLKQGMTAGHTCSTEVRRSSIARSHDLVFGSPACYSLGQGANLLGKYTAMVSLIDYGKCTHDVSFQIWILLSFENDMHSRMFPNTWTTKRAYKSRLHAVYFTLTTYCEMYLVPI